MPLRELRVSLAWALCVASVAGRAGRAGRAGCDGSHSTRVSRWRSPRTQGSGTHHSAGASSATSGDGSEASTCPDRGSISGVRLRQGRGVDEPLSHHSTIAALRRELEECTAERDRLSEAVSREQAGGGAADVSSREAMGAVEPELKT
jgi:hypothetical protein